MTWPPSRSRLRSRPRRRRRRLPGSPSSVPWPCPAGRPGPVGPPWPCGRPRSALAALALGPPVAAVALAVAVVAGPAVAARSGAARSPRPARSRSAWPRPLVAGTSSAAPNSSSHSAGASSSVATPSGTRTSGSGREGPVSTFAPAARRTAPRLAGAASAEPVAALAAVAIPAGAPASCRIWSTRSAFLARATSPCHPWRRRWRPARPGPSAQASIGRAPETLRPSRVLVSWGSLFDER